ncbi:WD repeat-containing protein [Yarrowia sp. B02]|nr:WD repeat-containing protein [Yarrowia sp. B02]
MSSTAPDRANDSIGPIDPWLAPKTKFQTVTVRSQHSIITCLQVTQDYIITACETPEITVYSKTGQEIRRLDGHSDGVWAMHFAHNLLATGGSGKDSDVRVWKLETGQCVAVLKGNKKTVRCVRVARDGRGKLIVISGARDNTVRVWDLSTADSSGNSNLEPKLPSATFRGHKDTVRCLDSYENTIVSGSYDGTVRVWSLDTRTCLHVLDGHSDRVFAAIIDPQRKQCVSASRDTTARIWSLETGQCLHVLKGHTSIVYMVELTPDYSHIVTGSSDGTLRVWSPTGSLVHTLEGHKSPVSAMQVDNDKIVSSATNMTVKLWDLQKGLFIRNLVSFPTYSSTESVWHVDFNGNVIVVAYSREGAFLDVIERVP